MSQFDWSSLPLPGKLLVVLLAIEVVALVVPLLIVAPFFVALGGAELSARAGSFVADATGAFGLPGRLGAFVLTAPKFLVMMLKSLRRNLVRTSLTYLATFLLVLIVSFVWSVLSFLDAQTREQAASVKVIVTEKFQVPSQMPPSYENSLADAATGLPPGMAADREKDLMSWAFVGTATDPNPANRSLENILFFFALQPKTLLTMMNEIERKDLAPPDLAAMEKNVAAMEKNIQGVIVGVDKLRAINKRVGDRIKLYSFNYKDIEFEAEIIGTFPAGSRYDQSSAMNVEYLTRTLDAFERKTGKRHPMADRAMNLYWARFPDKAGFETYAEVVGRPGRFSSPSVKVEMANAAVATFLDSWKDMLWAMRWLMSPAIVVTMIVIIANAISIGVRERQKEMAVLKVLGFRPWQILVLILGEALLIGVISGAIASALAWFLVNQVFNGIPLGIAFFGRFRVAGDALWWGPMLGALTALAGSFLPAWSARTVRVSEVFSKIA